MKRNGPISRNQSSRRPFPSPSLALVLEPRFMYDAAGGATAAAVAKTAAEAFAAAAHDGRDSGAAARESHGEASRAAAGPAAIADHSAKPVADVGPFGSKGEALFEVAEAASAAAAPPTEIVFVDARLPDAGDLAARPGVEIVVLDPSKDGIAQVNAALAGHSDIDAIHFVGHGDNGQFSLGSTVINAETVSKNATDIAAWGEALSADGDIMIWGCDVAANPAGQALINSLAMITGADVAASVDATGAASRGGDWVLESSTGVIETVAPFEAAGLASWEHVLDAPTITGTDVLRVAEPSSINASLGSSSTISLGAAGWGLSYNAGDADDEAIVSVTVADASVGTLSDTVGGGVSDGAGGWTFSGSLAEANAWLMGLTFTAADVEHGNAVAATSLSISVENLSDGGTASRTVAVEVTPSNDPVTLDDVFTMVDEVDGSGNPSSTVLTAAVLAPFDPEVDIGTQNASQIVYSLGTAPIHGYLTLDGVRIGAGSVFTQQDVIDGKLVYVHTATGAQQNTQDSFSITLNDGATPMALSDSAVVTLGINPVNQAPTVSGGGNVFEGQPANAASPGTSPSVVGNLIDATGGGDTGDSVLTIELTSLPTHGTLYFNGQVTIGGVTQTIDRAITAADIAAGISFAHADRAGLTYENDGIDDPTTMRPPNDSFGVRVTDGGGGAGEDAALSQDATIDLNVLAVDDEPQWVETSTLNASVPPGYVVTLDEAMLNATDVDSPDDSLTFVVTSQSGLDQGRLYLIPEGGGAPQLIPVGGTFTLADVKAGRVQYVQHLGANPGDTDVFNFQVLDNGVAVHWLPDGTSYERPGGVYADPADPDSALQTFAFTINLQPTPDGIGGALPDLPDLVPVKNTSTHAGTDQGTGETYGDLSEGGTVTIYDGKLGQPGLSYEVDGVEPEQVVYTIMGFNGVADGWNGEIQKLVDGDWVSLNVYDSFTQADLDAGNVRFVHDGGEDFESSVSLSASAGILVDDGSGNLVPDQWNTEFHFFITPVNDAPTAAGTTNNVIEEGDTVGITTGMLGFDDVDDTDSEANLETGSDQLPDGSGDNFAVNHDSANPLTFTIDTLPANGTLEYFNGTDWVAVTTSTVLEAAWITGDPATTRLRYVHDGGENTGDSFTVVATDRWGATSEIASVGFVITPVNDPPQIAPDPTQPDPTGPWPADPSNPGGGSGGANNPLNVIYEGSWQQITPDLLQAVDPDSSASQVQYLIKSAPSHGRLAYSSDGGVTFTTLGVGSSFTQADVEAGRIYYLNSGDEPTGTGYPDTPDDLFTFALSDGAGEVATSQFWIYVQPTNDAPVVTAPSGPIQSTDTSIDVPGFTVGDPDLADGAIPGIETDTMQVTVRLLDADGNPLPQSAYAGVILSVTAGGATIDGDTDGAGPDQAHDGVNGVLVLRGTLAEINAALGTLKVQFADDRDATYQVQVIADDRVRDETTGALIDTVPGGAVDPHANGGPLNQPEIPYTGEVLDISAYDGFDWYADPAPTADNADPDIALLVGNMSAATVRIHASTVNDPATLAGTDAAEVYEDQATNIGSQIDFAIGDAESEAFGTPVTVTLSVPSGTLNVGTPPAGITVAGANTGTLVLTGTSTAIQDFLNASLTYKSATNVNHDLNAGANGDVTLTVSFEDTGSNIGSDGTSANPPDLLIGLTIVPVNDAPTVAAGSGTVVLNGTTPVPGFVVNDRDVSGDGEAPTGVNGEVDFVQVTVRITDSTGAVLSALQHGDVTFSSTSAPAEGVTFEIDDTYDGTGSALVIRGTQAEVNAYLAGLNVAFSGTLSNGDAGYRVQVVADDRARDVATGALVGTAANGGENNNAAGGTTDVPTTAVNPYAAVPGGLTQNVSTAFRAVFPSSVNEPAHIVVTPPTVNEGAGTVQLSGIVITDRDALPTDDLSVTVTLESGFNILTAGTSTAAISISGNTATIVGTLTEINAALNGMTVQLPDDTGAPTRADWNGDFDVTIVVNDGGNNGDRPTSLTGDSDDPSSNPGDFSYEDATGGDADPNNDNHLVTTRTFTFTVNPVNDAPVVVPVGGSTEIVVPTTEDTPGGTGNTVGDLFEPYFDDALDGITDGSSSDDFIGVVVTGLAADPAQGEWQYFDGTDWVAIGDRTPATGLYLAAGTGVRFVPAADFHGTPAKMTVHLVENDTSDDAAAIPTPATGEVIDLSASPSTGGATRFSAGTVLLSTTVANVNDRPTLDDAVLPTIDEDTADPPGETVDNLFGGTFGDATDDRTGIAGGADASTGFGGIAIVGNAADPADGKWQYSTDAGGTWVDVPTGAGDAEAVLLAKDAMLRFLPADDFNGTPGGLTVRGADTVVDNTASADISGDLGQTSTWSATHALETTVDPLNDAPVLGGDASNPTATENNQTGTGVSIPPVALIDAGTATLTDLDLTTTPGLAPGVFGAGEIEVSLGASYFAGDRLQLDLAGYTLPDGVTIDLVADGTAGTLIIKLDADTTLAQVQEIIERVTYSSSNDNPTDFGTKTTRAYTVVVRDGNNADPDADTAGGPAPLASNVLSGVITIAAVNDPPVAEDNAQHITEGTASVTGNVITDPSPTSTVDSDPDTPVGDLTVTEVAFGGDTVAASAPIDGLYGTLTLNADGSYSYVLDSTNPAVNALKDGDTLTEVFTYTLSDGTGTDTATLTITIDGATDGVPTIVPTDHNGVGTSGENTVDETGLGSAGDTSETTTGSIVLDAPDGIGSINVGGTTLTLAELADLGTAPVVVVTPKGTLTLTGFTPSGSVGGVPTAGTLAYSYTLAENQDHSGGEVTDPIALEITDAGGDTDTGTLTILVLDDVPVAHDDTASITEDAAPNPITGNVITIGGGADTVGADGAGVTSATYGATPLTIGTAFTSAYGSLTLNADGSYSFTLDNANAAVNALKDGDTLTETFTYTITDGDGDTSTATLTITINGTTDGTGPSIVPDDLNGAATGDNTVDEAGLPDAGDTGETTTGSIAVSAPDGLESVSVGGVLVPVADLADLGTAPVVIVTPKGTLTLTGFTPTATVGGVVTEGTLTYSYTLAVDQDHSGGEVTDVFALTVTDVSAGSNTGELTILIQDDVPVAANDAASITEDGPSGSVDGNVFGGPGAGPGDVADDAGADGPAVPGPVTGVSFAGASGTLGAPLPGRYGTLTLNMDGSYSYVLDDTNPAVNALKDGDTLTEVFTYVIGDEDGDAATATLTITIGGATDGPPAIVPVDHNGGSTGENTVDEAGLGSGGDTSETTTGSILVTAPDGVASINVGGTTLTLAELADLGTNPVVIVTPKGTLTLTGFTPSASVGGVPTAGTLTYSYTLAENQNHAGGEVTDPIALVVTDAGGDSDAGTLTIVVLDDVPLANDDTASVTENTAPNPVTGNVIDLGAGRDVVGADGASVTSATYGGRPLTIGSPFASAYGALTLNADGSYSFVLDNNDPAVHLLQAGQVLTETFTYVITDGDGDTSVATLTITINGTNELVNTDSSYLGLPGYDQWGLLSPYDGGHPDDYLAGWLPYIEGRPADRYTTTWQSVSQQMLFRQWGVHQMGTLFYEARLGRDQPLPAWIQFDASTQVVTATPTDRVPPGVYVVRVIARDAAGNEAESTLTIHVLRDSVRSLDFVGATTADKPRAAPREGEPETPPEKAPEKAPEGGSPTEQPAPKGSAPPAPAPLAPAEPDGDVPDGPAPAPKPTGGQGAHLDLDAGKGAAAVHSSLTRALLNAGPTGQMIEAARFLEALAADSRPPVQRG